MKYYENNKSQKSYISITIIMILAFFQFSFSQINFEIQNKIIEDVKKQDSFQRLKKLAFIDSFEFTYRHISFCDNIKVFDTKDISYECNDKVKLNKNYHEPIKTKHKKINVKFSGFNNDYTMIELTIPGYLNMPKLLALYKVNKDHEAISFIEGNIIQK